MSNYENEKEKLLLDVAKKVKEIEDLKNYAEEFDILKSDKLRLMNQVQDNDFQINKAKVNRISYHDFLTLPVRGRACLEPN